MKTCARCRLSKQLRDFSRQSRRPDGLHPWCRDCCREYNREWRQRPGNRERRQAWRRANEVYDRAARVQYLYGISPDRLDELLAQQGGCAVCGTPEAGGRWGTWHVDHDHNCCPGKRSCGRCVRGLLCQNCNILLGHAKDDPNRLAKAMAYLEKVGAV